MSRNRKTSKAMMAGILVILSLIMIFLIVRGAVFSKGNQATEVVEEFYLYEQKGEFSQSWSLFHSAMKEKFAKGHYIQDRAHVFMNHFGVETFTFELGEPEELEKWNITKGGPEYKNVYMVPVTQTYKGKYGNFDIKQEVFAVKEKDQWKILWDYNQ